MKQLLIRSVMGIAVILITVMRVAGQTSMPDVFLKNPLNEQMNYLDQHTKIYEDYRAIREDMFQKIKSNVSDTLSASLKKVSLLKLSTKTLTQTIDSLKLNLAGTKTSLDDMTKSKNSIKVLGLEINKSAYNKVMWSALAILGAALLLGFLIFKRNLALIESTKKEYDALKAEFETYKKTSREAREKMTMSHFLEMKKLKGE
jgi:hypothetical protein